MADDEENQNVKWKWGLDFQKTPCARESLLLGISSGLLIGGVVFLKTKKVRKSCDFAVGSFAVLSFVAWEICSYKRYREREEIQNSINLLNEYEEKRAHSSELEPTES